MPITLGDLRRFAAAHTLVEPTTLRRAIDRLGFVQADPIRAPARAQDLVLRHRAIGYRAGDLERRYARLGVEEDYFVNYGFVTRALQGLMHPRRVSGRAPWSASRRKHARALLDFVRERGIVHPREVDARFSHGKVENYWGGQSNATTQLLDALHYRGLLRVVRRAGGVRMYEAREHGPAPSGAAERRARLDALVDAVVAIYAPLPAPSLPYYVRRLRQAAPQWRGELTDALRRCRERLSHARVEGVDWYWPSAEDAAGREPRDVVRLLAPFDPVVHDRPRFELLWGWTYRFEAYTPPARRKLGYYALPMLWRDRVIGWGNLAVEDGELRSEIGYVASRPPRDRAFARELDAELHRVRAFLGLEAP